MKIFHVAIASDKTYLNGAIGTLASLRLSLEKSVSLNVLYMHNGLEMNKMEIVRNSINKIQGNTSIEFVEIKEDFSKYPRFPGATQLTYARFLLPKLAKSNKILYIDADLLVLKNLEKIFDLDLTQTGIAAVKDHFFHRIYLDFNKSSPIPVDLEASYFNAGFLVMDIQAIMKNGTFETAIEYLNRFPDSCKYHDQSALNYAVNGKFHELAAKFNLQKHRGTPSPEESIGLIDSRDVCIHFVAPDKKPWLVYSNEPSEKMFRILLDYVYPQWRNEKMNDAKLRWIREMRLAKIRPFINRVKASLKKIQGKNATDQINAARFWSAIIKDQNEIKLNKYKLESIYSLWQKEIKNSLV